MKKVILLALSMLFLIPVFALANILPTKIYACSTQNIAESSLVRGKLLSFHAIDAYRLPDNSSIEKGSVVTVKVTEYVKPKRGKRNGYAKVKFVSYTVPTENNATINKTDEDYEGTIKLSTPLDKKKLAEKAGVTVVGQALKVPGFSQAVAVSKGLIDPNPNQNRIESAGTNLYNSTPLTYTEAGKGLKIEEDSIVVITIK